MLKMKKKVISGLFLMTVFSTFCVGNAFAAGNIQDTNYSFSYTGDGGDLYTAHRDKYDYTSSYVYHKGSVGAYIGVYNGYNSYGPLYHVGAGQQRYLTNYIKENGLNSCRLRITPETHSPRTIYGQWSPDSV